MADASAGGRVAIVLEGGYDLVGLEAGLASAIQGVVRGEATDISPPLDSSVDIFSASAVASRAWKLA